MPDVRPDPKPVSEGGIGRRKPDRGNRRRGRITASLDGWIELRAEKLDGRTCRICDDPLLEQAEINLRTPRPAAELHHLVPRSLGGDDVADNLVGLCQPHHFSITTRKDVTLSLLAALLTDAEYAYVVGKLGEGGMERLFGVGR